MQNYELLFILPGTLVETEVKPLIDQVKDAVLTNGGVDFSVEDMGKSRLAYPINHIRYGYFQLAHFKAETETVLVIEKKLRLLGNTLRILIQKYDPNKKVQKINFSDQTFAEPVMGAPVETVNSTTAPVVVTTTNEQDVALNISHAQPKEERKTTSKKTAKVNLDDIDKKLDEILEIDIDKV